MVLRPLPERLGGYGRHGSRVSRGTFRVGEDALPPRAPFLLERHEVLLREPGGLGVALSYYFLGNPALRSFNACSGSSRK